MKDFSIDFLLAFVFGLDRHTMPATNIPGSGKIEGSFLDLVSGAACVTMLALLVSWFEVAGALMSRPHARLAFLSARPLVRSATRCSSGLPRWDPLESSGRVEWLSCCAGETVNFSHPG